MRDQVVQPSRLSFRQGSFVRIAHDVVPSNAVVLRVHGLRRSTQAASLQAVPSRARVSRPAPTRHMTKMELRLSPFGTVRGTAPCVAATAVEQAIVGQRSGDAGAAPKQIP